MLFVGEDSPQSTRNTLNIDKISLRINKRFRDLRVLSGRKKFRAFRVLSGGKTDLFVGGIS